MKKENKKVKIYIATHKAFTPPNIPEYVPIQVGKARTELDFGYLTDYTGDNISIKNNNYCELTALYWIWKNDKESDIVGLCHYRRYFIKSHIQNIKNLIKQNKVIKLLKNNEVILPKKKLWAGNVENCYIKCAGKNEDERRRAIDLQVLRDVFNKKDKTYLPALEEILASKYATYANMIIARKNVINEYCEWLFSILFAMEEEMIKRKIYFENSRVFGFISEILLGVWIRRNKLKVKYCSILNTEFKTPSLLIKKVKHFWNNHIKKRG